MITRRLFLLAVPVLLCTVALPARGADSWEAAAIKGIKTMNQGDGEGFAENAHTEFKTRMRRFMIGRMRAEPTSSDTLKCLKDYGVPSIDELEELPLDRFVQTTIHSMHLAVPQPMRTAMKEAQFKVVAHELHGDICRVTVETTFTLGGKSGARKLDLLVKREGGRWRYNGDSNSAALYSK